MSPPRTFLPEPRRASTCHGLLSYPPVSLSHVQYRIERSSLSCDAMMPKCLRSLLVMSYSSTQEGIEGKITFALAREQLMVLAGADKSSR